MPHDIPCKPKKQQLGILILIACGLAGCQSTAQKEQTNKLNAAIEAYDRNEFHEAQMYADRARRGPDAQRRYTASYVSGLAAWNLDEESEARMLFLDAKKAGDRATAGGANAMLGRIALDDSRYRQAAEHFDIASQSLSEPDASKARRWANTARRLAGIRTAPISTAKGPWAIQFGAFASETRARRAQRDLVKNPRVIQLGRVEVISSKQGDGLYLVQMGSYQDRQKAMTDLQKLSSLECIVVPMTHR